MRAILSDIHANLEALDAVLRDIAAQGIPEIWCLGDLIGFGPDPAACVDLAMDWEVNLRGNFEEQLNQDVDAFNSYARECIRWERSQLGGDGPSSAGPDRVGWLRRLPLSCELEDVLLVHGSPRAPKAFEYLALPEESEGDVPWTSGCQSLFQHFRRICFVGHSHVPGVLAEGGKVARPGSLAEGAMVLDPHKKYFVNVGSVGQPRDHDPRACYVVWDGDSVRYRRVPYDIRETQRKILATGVLSWLEANRLEPGR